MDDLISAIREAVVFPLEGREFVVEALKDFETYSNHFIMAMGGGGEPDPEMAEIMKTGYPPVDTMLTADPPEQKRYRSLVDKAFRLKRVRSLEPRMRARTRCANWTPAAAIE